GAPIGLGFSALIFFGSFLYQDKKERVNCSLQYFYIAMQRFSFALWKVLACIAIQVGVSWSYKCLAPTGLVASYMKVIRQKRG
ncbi:MAG TPA: hypothetical protein PL153_10900, partial [Tenuifilum sp.]|nr:hypothetical protein [Tenuifilum sp.]